MKNIEFHTDPRTGKPMFRKLGEPHAQELTERDVDIVDYILTESKTFYPEQFRSVREFYKKSSSNPRFYDWQCARRIINCCFGDNDYQADVDEFGNYHFEHVKCPLIAECKYHHIICLPKFDSKLTPKEIEVMKLYFRHYKTAQIAEALYISIHTVRNHRKNVLRKLQLHSLQEYVDYVHSNNIIEIIG